MHEDTLTLLSVSLKVRNKSLHALLNLEVKGHPYHGDKEFGLRNLYKQTFYFFN